MSQPAPRLKPILKPISSPPTAPGDLFATPQEHPSRLPIIIAIVAVLLVFGVGGIAIVYGPSLMTRLREGDQVLAVVDRYMRAMAAKDINQAYALFSPLARGQGLRTTLEARLSGRNYARFAGYESAAMGSSSP